MFSGILLSVLYWKEKEAQYVIYRTVIVIYYVYANNYGMNNKKLSIMQKIIPNEKLN